MATKRTRSGPLRTLAPYPTASTTQPSPASSEPVRQRSRRHVSTACQTCKKLKIKCDGIKPTCSACTRRALQCIYQIEADGRRTKELKQDYANLKSSSRDVLDLYELLRSMPADEAAVALNHIRTAADPSSALSLIRGDSLMMRSPSLQETNRNLLPPMQSDLEFELSARHPVSYPILEPLYATTVDLSLLGKAFDRRIGRVKRIKRDDGFERFVNPSLSFSLPPEEQVKPEAYFDSRLYQLNISQWTNVNLTSPFAAKVISLYLANDHPLLSFFDADLFLDDLIFLRHEYCSKLLVNSLLAWACQAYAAVDQIAATLSYACYNEAIRIWRVERGKDRLTTVAATSFLSLCCDCYGIDKTGLTFLYESAQMGQRLQLFGSPVQQQFNDPGANHETENRARAATAWGVFTWHIIHTFYCHQPLFITAPPPFLIPGDLKQEGDQDNSDYFSASLTCGYAKKIFPACCKLWLIGFDVVSLYYRDSGLSEQTVPSSIADEFYRRLLEWADHLPQHLVRGPFMPHQVLCLHIWYHTIILDVHRPLLRPTAQLQFSAFTSSRTRPEAVYAASIKQLKRMSYLYRSTYDSANTSFLWHTSLLYVANAILKDESDPELRFYFLICLRGYQSLMQSFRVAGSIAQGLLSIAIRNGVLQPTDAHELRKEIQQDPKFAFKTKEITSGFIVDLDLSLTDPTAASLETLVKQFDELSVVTAHGVVGSQGGAEGAPTDFWRGDPGMLSETLI